jgi:hypothetical protein
MLRKGSVGLFLRRQHQGHQQTQQADNNRLFHAGFLVFHLDK